MFFFLIIIIYLFILNADTTSFSTGRDWGGGWGGSGGETKLHVTSSAHLYIHKSPKLCFF